MPSGWPVMRPEWESVEARTGSWGGQTDRLPVPMSESFLGGRVCSTTFDLSTWTKRNHPEATSNSWKRGNPGRTGVSVISLAAPMTDYARLLRLTILAMGVVESPGMSLTYLRERQRTASMVNRNGR
jgi:hypothetical protein